MHIDFLARISRRVNLEPHQGSQAFVGTDRYQALNHSELFTQYVDPLGSYCNHSQIEGDTPASVALVDHRRSRKIHLHTLVGARSQDRT